jgi:hypothetical protein
VSVADDAAPSAVIKSGGNPWAGARETLENGPHCRGADDRLGRAVVDDVGGLGGGEVVLIGT